MFFSTRIGNGFPPGYVAQGFERLTLVRVSLLPKGTVCPYPVREISISRSENIPNAARTEVRPLPVASHANPTRGRNSFHLLHSIFVPHSYCASPGKTTPTGAFTNKLVCRFLSNRLLSKYESAPYLLEIAR